MTPGGVRDSPPPSSGEGPRFVVHEHVADTHHFDFGLQVGDVLRFWRVPRGPSTDPTEHRAALPLEDRPVEPASTDEADDEAPREARVWDAGTYVILEEDEDGMPVPIADQLEWGHVTVWLAGRKLRGGYELVRDDDGPDAAWELIKVADSEADGRHGPVGPEPSPVLVSDAET